jgi:CheY-like chemotaxis protein
MSQQRILIVEDNARNLKLERDVLEVKGYHVRAATTAEEGLVLARDDPPDLVVMDIGLPGMDGITALRHLRADARTRDIPVIAVTASVMQSERTNILAAGFDGYLGKPIEIFEFLQLVQNALAPKP